MRFVGILSGVGDIFLPGCPQVFFPDLGLFLNHIKVQSKKKNYLINSIDV